MMKLKEYAQEGLAVRVLGVKKAYQNVIQLFFMCYKKYGNLEEKILDYFVVL